MSEFLKSMSRFLVAFFFFPLLLFFSIPPVSVAEVFQGTVDDYRAKGYEAQQKGNFDQALAFYMKALAIGEKNATLYNDIGVVYEELGVYDRAIYNYEQSISMDPKYLLPYANLGYLHKEQGQTTEALKYFKERFERGGENDPSREKIRLEIFALDPTYKDRIVQGELESTRQVLEEKARVNFDQDVARGERHLEQARKFIAEKNYEKAMKEFDRALAIAPNNPKTIREKQRTIYEQQMEAVKAAANSALKKLEAGDVEAARMEFQNILAIIPDNSTPKTE